MSTTRKFLSNARWAMVAKIISATLSIPLFIVLARSLGSKSFGMFALIISILTFARILGGSGLGHSTGKHLAGLQAEGNTSKIKSFLAAGFITQTVVAIVLAVAIWLFSSRIAAGFRNDALTPALKIGAVILIFFAITEFAKASVQGLQRFKYLALLTGVEFSTKLVFAGGLVLAGFGLTGALNGFALALGITSLVALALFLRLGMMWPTLSRQDWRSLISYSLPLMVTTAGFVIYTELDNVMIGYYSGDAAVGLYSAAMQIARAIPLLALPIGQAAAPIIVKMRRDEPGQAAEFVHRLLKYMVACFFPLAAAVFVLSPKILTVVYGASYAGSGPALRVMSVFVLSLSLGVVVTPILDYLGQAGRRAAWMTISVIANVVLNFILIPRYGGLGAAAATAVTHAPYVFNNVGILARTVVLKPSRIFISMGRIFLASVLAGAAGASVLFVLDNMVLTLIIGGVIYIGILLVTGVFSRGEIVQIANKVRVGAKQPVSIK